MNSTNNHLNESSKRRKSKKSEGKLIKVLVFCVVALLILLIVLNFGRVTAPLEGIGYKITGNKSAEVGFPVKLPGSSSYSAQSNSQFNAFDGGFVLLTETYVYTYGSNGGLVFDYQHSCGTPKSSVNEKRILVYDENGRKFALFNRNGVVYEKETEERIVFAVIGNGEKSAVVSRSSVYSNILEIYDGYGDWKYRKRFLDENVLQVAFSPSDSDIVVTCAGFDNAAWDTTATVGRYSTTSDNENGVWQVSLPNNTLPYAVYVAGDSVYVLSDNAFYVLDYSDGKIVGNYAYSGELTDFAFSDNSKNACAILADGHAAGSNSLISLNSKGELNFVTEVSEEATQAEIQGEEVAVIQPNSIRLYKAESSGVTAKVTET
ncbi:MAG: DUF5711 family protein, partial [Oscillospiraceae bacterium]|nr:DUF5711 family protein [Oscillospiraceae bacterium]